VGSASSGEWPLTATTESLVIDLLSPTWFVRHGAALGIIEILTAAGSRAGCRDGLDAAQQREANTDFLSGVAACLLVMLALDRYADFDSQVCSGVVQLARMHATRLTLVLLRLRLPPCVLLPPTLWLLLFPFFQRQQCRP